MYQGALRECGSRSSNAESVHKTSIQRLSCVHDHRYLKEENTREEMAKTLPELVLNVLIHDDDGDGTLLRNHLHNRAASTAVPPTIPQALLR